MPVTLTDRNRRATDDYTSVSITNIRVGAQLRAPIYEDRTDVGGPDVLLLTSGMQVTESLLEKLRHRGITHVRIHRRELSRLTTGGNVRLANHQARDRAKNLARSGDEERTGDRRWNASTESLIHDVRLHGTAAYERQERRRFMAIFQDSVQHLDSMFEQLAAGDVHDTSKLAVVCSESLMNITNDLDLFVALGLQPATDKYPCKHSLQTAMLAMSIGTILGLKPVHLIELGMGCLLHDAGMLRIDERVVNSNRPLTPVEFLEITKHPMVTYDLMQRLTDIPNGSRMVAYQMHERLDGSGYPRKRHGNQIHPLAKIAAVADVYVALVSPRPHRAGMLPYRAVEVIIQGTHRGLYDSEVTRALLHTISMFPIGSFVRTNDGRVGQVLRSNREAYMRPVVELWRPEDSARIDVVDLNAQPGLNIVGTLRNADRPHDEECAATPHAAAAVAEFWE